MTELLSRLAEAVPRTQEYLDLCWAANYRLALSKLSDLDQSVLPELARAILPERQLLAVQTAEFSCHVSSREETGTEVKVGLRFTPLSVGVALRHERVLRHACRIELTVEQVAMQPDQPSEGENNGSGK